MTDWHQKTIDTYNASAERLSEYLSGIGARSNYINLALSVSGKPHPSVVEIGCGDGRDAAEITKHASSYIGFDPSERLIELARSKVPQGNFVVADALSFSYPADQDIVFAFASILHLDSSDLKAALGEVHKCLKTDGILYISSKYSDKYRSEVKNDEFGERMFHYYNIELLQDIMGDKFSVVAWWRETIGHTEWFEMILQKA